MLNRNHKRRAEAKEQYQADFKTIKLFLEERTMAGDHGRAHALKASIFYRAYAEWCQEVKTRALSQRRVARILLDMGFGRFLGGDEWSYRWTGIALKEPAK